MQIIIPMTGNGSRFVDHGYKDIKPLIKVQGKPIIQWIREGIYPNEDNFIFVCRGRHLETITGMEYKIKSFCPTAKIVSIDNWVKKGPVYDILRAADAIDDNEPCIVNYCDVYMDWDYENFKKEALARDCDGAVPCYTGFHPHLLTDGMFYASCLTDEDDNLIEIREKFSFEDDKTRAKHSPGVYYYKNGAILKKYCQAMVDADENINGEYYSSLTYNYMVRDGLKVWVPYDVKKYCQWGTPEDMEEYVYWTEYTRRYK